MKRFIRILAICGMASFGMQSQPATATGTKPISISIPHVSFGKWKNLRIEISAFRRDGPSYLGHWGGNKFRLTFYRNTISHRNLIHAYVLSTDYPHVMTARFAVYKGIALLAIDGSGGQFPHVTVYKISSQSLLPTAVSEPIIEGDSKRLIDGVITEYCPDKYVESKPPSFHRRNPNVAELIKRIWRFHTASAKFIPGKYIFDTS